MTVQCRNELFFLLAQVVNGLSGDVAEGQRIVLPCGRLLTYITAFDAGLLTKAAAVSAPGG